MPNGYNGKILRVNLSNRSYDIEELNERFYRKYLGGRALGLYYMLKEVAVSVSPFDSKNKIIFAPSIITGSPIPGTSRHSVVSKSPLTGGYAESEAGGYWGVELKKAGFDAVIVEGKSEKPCYISIVNNNIAIKDASHIWGKDTGEAQEIIRKEIDHPKARLAIIGQGGENLVRFACIVNDLNHVNGRSGLGAVMGSKMLKAISVVGTGRIKLADREKCLKLAKYFVGNYQENADNKQLNRYGTSQYYINANNAGILPTENFKGGYFKDAEKVSHLRLDELLVKKHEGCYACPINCKIICESNEPIKIDGKYGGPEFESMVAFSSLLRVDDIYVMVKANELCNRYGIDTIATGNVIGFAMECFEKGILSKKDTNGIELKFGNGTDVLELIEKIAFKKGFGKLLAEGVKRISDFLGGECKNFAMHVKGQELPMHEPRGKYGVGLGYAVSPIGGDHLQAEHDGAFDPVLTGYSHHADSPSFFSQQIMPLGILESVESLSIGYKKVRLFTYLQNYWSLFNSLDLCIFAFGPVRTFKINQIVEIVKAVTGWDTSLWELMKVGERGTTMARCFNLLNSVGKNADILPERLFEPLQDGAFKGSKLPREKILKAITLYYQMMGWDTEGIPTEGRLAELGLNWVKLN